MITKIDFYGYYYAYCINYFEKNRKKVDFFVDESIQTGYYQKNDYFISVNR